MNDPGHIRKTVGTQRERPNPVQRAWELRCLLLKLRGELPLPDDEHVRKAVGRTEPFRCQDETAGSGPSPLMPKQNADILAEEAQRATELLHGKVVARAFRHRTGEFGLEFTDGTRLFVDWQHDGLDLSVTGGVDDVED